VSDCVWTTPAIATVLAEVGGEFERTSGHGPRVVSDRPAAFARRAAAGEPFDLLISGSATVDEWVRAGRVTAATRTDLARSGIGVAVRAGAPKPPLSSIDAFRHAVLGAKIDHLPTRRQRAVCRQPIRATRLGGRRALVRPSVQRQPRRRQS